LIPIKGLILFQLFTIILLGCEDSYDSSLERSIVVENANRRFSIDGESFAAVTRYKIEYYDTTVLRYSFYNYDFDTCFVLDYKNQEVLGNPFIIQVWCKPNKDTSFVEIEVVTPPKANGIDYKYYFNEELIIVDSSIYTYKFVKKQNQDSLTLKCIFFKNGKRCKVFSKVINIGEGES